uniref:Uncharacterized protein n=1 Tax=Oryza punctata TaxID=4537 RepID=A0A0E0K7P7_ORYPU
MRSKESAVRKTRKGKGIENPNMKRNKHAPSERAQDCKSTKALIRDNSMILDHIDDKLRTGQLACAPSMFDKVKTNMDAILAKMRAMGINTDEYKIDLEALEEIKRGFHPSVNSIFYYILHKLSVRNYYINNMMALILLPVLLLLTIFRVTNDEIDYLPVLTAAMTNVHADAVNRHNL